MKLRLTNTQISTLLDGAKLEKKTPDPTSDTFESDQLHDWVIDGISLGIKNGLKPPQILLESETQQLLWAIGQYRSEIGRLKSL